MKHLQDFLFTGFLTLATTASATVSVSNVIVRQQWPWSTDIRIEYAVTGASAADAVDVAFEAYSGATDLGPIPASALKGERVGISADDSYVVSFNPSNVPCLKTRTVLENFVVKATTTATATQNLEKLYAIVDLKTASNVTYVTRADLLNGKYGTYETVLPWISNSSIITNADAAPIIWTGVTNNPIYSTDCLVLRHIPAGQFMMGNANESTGQQIYHSVRLTNDYWIGVFEITQEQWYNLMGAPYATWVAGDPDHTDRCSRRPMESGLTPSEKYIRGYFTDARYCWPTGREIDPDSFCGKLAKLTGMTFDLPTEAQWEYACRAGTTTDFYSGANIVSNYLDVGMITLQRSPANGGYKSYTVDEWGGFTASEKWDIDNYPELGRTLGPTGATAIVGSYLPNAWGLYDMYGNVEERCRDWYSDSYWTNYVGEVVEPEGPSEPNSTDENSAARVARGGEYGHDHGSYYWNKSSIRGSSWRVNWHSVAVGLRLYAPFKATGSN